MRIVNRTDFLAMPAGTVFMKFPSQPDDPARLDLAYDGVIGIKGATICGNDFGVQPLMPFFEGANNDGDWFDIMVTMIAGKSSPAVDYDFMGRDGLFDREQMFLVWEKDDLRRMIARLTDALVDGHPES
jgi:hypothetical protein